MLSVLTSCKDARTHINGSEVHLSPPSLASCSTILIPQGACTSPVEVHEPAERYTTTGQHRSAMTGIEQPRSSFPSTCRVTTSHPLRFRAMMVMTCSSARCRYYSYIALGHTAMKRHSAAKGFPEKFASSAFASLLLLQVPRFRLIA